MERLRELWGKVRKYGNHAIVGACVLAWAIAFKSGFANSEWQGFWASSQPTRGSSVVIKEKVVETTAERDRRLAKQRKQTSELNEKLHDLRKDFLGDGKVTRGDALRFKQQIPKDVARFTQRDVCFQMQLEEPERWKDVDCMSDKFDDTEPWFLAPRQ